MEPVTFIHVPNIAGANPTVAILPIAFANPDAKLPFCIPTSIAMVRQSRSFILNSHPDQYPNRANYQLYFFKVEKDFQPAPPASTTEVTPARKVNPPGTTAIIPLRK
jgi:hypothetical protein